MNEVRIKELQTADILKIWWGFLWKALVISLGSMLSGAVAGAIFGAIVGVIVTLSGGSQETISNIAKIGGGILGLGIGMYFFYIYLCWLLKSKFGNFRLALIKIENTPIE